MSKVNAFKNIETKILIIIARAVTVQDPLPKKNSPAYFILKTLVKTMKVK